MGHLGNPGPGVVLPFYFAFSEELRKLLSVSLLNWERYKMANSTMQVLHSSVLQLPITCGAVIIK